MPLMAGIVSMESTPGCVELYYSSRSKGSSKLPLGTSHFQADFRTWEKVELEEDRKGFTRYLICDTTNRQGANKQRSFMCFIELKPFYC